MSIKRVSPEEALALVKDESYVYLDVRSVREFDAGHPAGAFNIPLADFGPGGMTPNPRFVEAVGATFAKETPIVVGCKAGGRSLQASQMLTAAGFTRLVDQRAGFDGTPTEDGWRPKGLPTSTIPEPGRSWAEIDLASQA